MIEVFSSGGGTQSAAITALIVQGRLPKPDIVVIADTGREMPTTWAYWDAVIVPALASVGVRAQRIPFEYQIVPGHGKQWLDRSGKTILLPLWTNQSGSIGRFQGFCTGTWKRDVRNRYIRRIHGIKRSKSIVWIGYSFDERKRIERMMKGKEYRRGLIWFPLVHGVLMRHEDSHRLIREMGWPPAPRSRCFDCPHQSDYEWREVKQDWPEYFQRAVEREREIQAFDPHCYYHQSCIPLDKVDFSRGDDLFSATAGCFAGTCFI